MRDVLCPGALLNHSRLAEPVKQAVAISLAPVAICAIACEVECIVRHRQPARLQLVPPFFDEYQNRGAGLIVLA